VVLQAIEQPPADFASPQEAFAQALQHERRVTGLIQNLYQIAARENDPSSLPLLHWFLEEQIEEEKTVEQILEALRRIGEDGTGLVMMDRELARREAE
jgi:ferritin